MTNPPRIKDLYTYLVTNRRAAVDAWLRGYQKFTGEVAQIQSALERPTDIRDKAAYSGTRFANEADPWPAFARCLIYEHNNGVTSRGQSVLSEKNFDVFIADEDFIQAVAALIARPDKQNYNHFAAAWKEQCERQSAYLYPLLVHRVLSACTTKVTSTVDHTAFNTVYDWLVNEDFIPRQDGDWFDRNVQVMDYLRGEFAAELASEDTSEHLLSMFVWYLRENIGYPFTLKKQIIRYGAPGTGKTYSAKRDTRLQFQIWSGEFALDDSFNHLDHCEIVQFHPSFGYEDFMEGLRPELTNGQARLILQNGVFKRFCQRAAAWETDVFTKIPVVGPDLAKKWHSLTIGELLPYAGLLTGAYWQHILSHPHRGKKVVDAVPPYFFIIDEINRAELSRVLGELMLSLEYRGVEGAISTQYAALNTNTTGLLDMDGAWKFFVPHNVYLIGTMNTIDRSVESFDLALRRRFRWERVVPDLAVLGYHLKQHDERVGNALYHWAGLENNLEKLNAAIRSSPDLGPDYEIGHAYLMSPRYPDEMTRNDFREEVWNDAISPLLEEYLRGDDHSDRLLAEFRKSFCN